MSDNTFEIVFHGVLVPGADPAQVKRNFAALFKTEAAKVEPLFSGKRFVIKKGLDQATALKYQKALREAGAVVQVEDAAAAARDALQASLDKAGSAAPAARPAAVPPAAPRAAAPAAPSAPEPQVAAGNFTMDPVGVILVAPEKVEPLQVETSHLVLDQPGVTLVAPSAVVPLQVNLSGMTMAEPGVVLKEPETVPDLKVDTGAMTMAEAGATLVEPAKVTPPVIDTSNLKLA
jgi:hypothetical protein